MRFKRVLLINPFPYYAEGINEATVYQPLGMAYIASVLRENGILCKILDVNILEIRPHQALHRIKSFNPDLVGINVSLLTARAGKELCKVIKDNLSCELCFGGVFATSHFDSLLKDTKADYAIRGEGEFTTLELCKGVELKKIKGLAYKSKSGVVVNGPRELIKDLDSLPFPAYDLMPAFSVYRSRSRKKPMAAIMTSRGCPFNCTYCNSNIFGKKFRARSPKNVIKEIDMLVKKYGVRQIDILDDNFTLDIDRANKILDLIISRDYKILLNLQNGIRADRLNYELVKKMKKARVFKVGIGVESGSPEILKSINKNLDLNDVIKATKWFRKQGIVVVTFFMIGFPQDTEETINQTIDFAVKLDAPIVSFARVTPLPQTEMYDELRAKGFLYEKSIDKGLNTGFFGQDFYYKNENLSNERIIELYNKAYRKVYFRPKKILDNLLGIRSFSEFKWFIGVAVPILKNLF